MGLSSRGFPGHQSETGATLSRLRGKMVLHHAGKGIDLQETIVGEIIFGGQIDIILY